MAENRGRRIELHWDIFAEKAVLALEELQVCSSHLWLLSFVPEHCLLGTLNAFNVL